MRARHDGAWVAESTARAEVIAYKKDVCPIQLS